MKSATFANHFIKILVILTCLSVWLPAQTPLSTAFTYQGRLMQNGQPFSGPANLVFRLYDNSTVGNPIGTSQTLSAIPIVNGLFAVVLNSAGEFGPNALSGDKRWLQLAVNGTILSPRQELTGVPYALQTRGIFVNDAGNVGIGTTTPGGSLQVNGGIRARGGQPGGLGVNNNGYAFSGNNGDNDSGLFSSSDGSVALYTNAVTRLFVGSTGYVGINRPAFDATLNVHGNAGHSAIFHVEDSVNTRIFRVNSDGSVHVFGTLFVTNLPFGDKRNVQWDNTTGQLYYDNSSRRDKENIEPLQDDFDMLLSAKPKTYTRPGVPDRREIGFIAEEFDDLGLSKLVDYDHEGKPDGINYEKICLYLTEIAKHQQHKITAQEQQISKLRLEKDAEIAAQKTQVTDLSKRLVRVETLLDEVLHDPLVVERQRENHHKPIVLRVQDHRHAMVNRGQ